MNKTAQIIDTCFKVAIIALLVWLLVQRAGNVPETGIKLASVTQTANPTITVNNGSKSWTLDTPHTVNDAANYLNRTPDTIRDYIPRWIDDGAEIEKTQGGMWVLPKGFEPYIPE